MTNGLIFVIYLPLAIITSVIIVVAYGQNRSQQVIRDFVTLCVAVLGWQVVEMVYTLATDPGLICWLFDAKLIFVAFSAVLVLRFTFRFFRMEQFLGRGLFVVLCVVPAVTAVLALTSPWHPLIRTRLEVLAVSPLHLMINDRGVWFWVHTVYSYLMLLLSALVVLIQHRSLPRAYRLPSSMVALGVGTTMVCNIAVITLFNDHFIDFTLIGMSLSLVFVFVGVSMSRQADFLMLARTEVFHYLDDRVFVLDTARRVIDANHSAQSWMGQLGVHGEFGKLHFGEITGRMHDAGIVGEAKERYLAEPGGQVVFRIRERAVTDRLGQELGVFVTFTDVTRYKQLIDELEKTAGVDPLTGLGNRRSYQSELVRLDKPEHLPMSLIIGDLNGLKIINDTLGHEQGDALLRVAAALLRRACPPGARIFRIGGDEFVALLPGVPSVEAEEIAREIAAQFAARTNLPFRPSIALGTATKEHPEQDYDTLLRLADRRMYASKRADRRKGPLDRRVADIPLPPGVVDRRRGRSDRRESPDRRNGPHDRRDPSGSDEEEDQAD